MTSPEPGRTTIEELGLASLERVEPMVALEARPGHVRVTFGAPMRLTGTNYEALAGQVEAAAVRALRFMPDRAPHAHSRTQLS
jgi:hypothetical protein